MKEDNIVTVDRLYQELAEETRYHLRWRERLLVGFVAVPGALALVYDKVAFPFKWVVPLSGFVLSIAIFWLEERCHDILVDRRSAGTAIEILAGHKGVFRSADKMSTGRRPSHTDTLRILYLLGGLAFAVWAMVEFSYGYLSRTYAEVAALSLFIFVPLVLAVWHVYREGKKYRETKQTKSAP